MMRALSVSAVTAAMTAAAVAQAVSPFNTDDCPEPTVYRWCALKATAAGWQLKHQSESLAGMMDVSWRTEIWVRGHEAMLCNFNAGRGVPHVNSCHAMQEVGE
jgi:hypothetical protein